MTEPTLSIVIAATDSPEAALAASEALQGDRFEVIVVASFALPSPAGTGAGGGGYGPTPDDRRGTRILAAAGSGVPRLRRLGLEAARGRVVAFTEDSCLARLGWAEAWAEAFDDPDLVAGTGSVEPPERPSPLDQAVFACEYAPFLPGGREASPDRLAGNNFAIIREVALALTGPEVHETALLASVRKLGGRARTVEHARVRHVRRFGWRGAFGDRLRFGVEFGRLRTIDASPVVRWLGLVAGPAIFASQVLRLEGIDRADPRGLGLSARAWPITMALLAAWSLGEWLGWSLGPPRPARRRRGTSARRPGPPPCRSGSPPPGCTPARLDA